MDNDVAVFAQVMTVIVVTVGSLVGIGLGAFAMWRRIYRSTPAKPQPLDDARLERLEAAVDVIAIEVERISESQRFAVGLLSDRLPAGRGERITDVVSPKRNNTPH